MRRLICCVLLALSAAACAGQGPPAARGPDPAVERGQKFAQMRCSGCHAVGLDDAPATSGPPFRILGRRYNALSLEHRFAEISAHGSGEMPPLEIPPSTAQDLVAYFESLQAPGSD